MTPPSKSNESTPLLHQAKEETHSNGLTQEVNNTKQKPNAKSINHEAKEKKSVKMSSSLPSSFIFGYSLGHVFNDFCSSIWFSYMLIFFANIMELGAAAAGVLMLVGQIADALATALAGWIIDKRWRSKAFNHLIGSFLVWFSFPAMFLPYPGYSSKTSSTNILAILWYSVFIIAFQVGWAFVQISHLSMIPKFGKNEEERQDLTIFRFLMQIFSGVVAYIIVWCVFHTGNVDRMTPNLTPNDRQLFIIIAATLCVLGALCTWAFQHIVNAYSKIKRTVPRITPKVSVDEELGEEPKTHNATLYQVAIVWVVAKVYSVLNAVYVPLWIDEREKVARGIAVDKVEKIPSDEIKVISVKGSGGVEDIAMVPLLISIASVFGAALVLKYQKKLKNLRLYILGIIICSLSAIYVFFLQPTDSPNHLYGIAILIGTGSSMSIVTSGFMAAEIASRFSRGFTYAFVTFADKIIVGVLVVISEYVKCTNWELCPYYYQHLLITIAVGATFVGLATSLSISCTTRRLI